MSADVHVLEGGSLPGPARPDPRVVAVARDLLARAEAGEITGLAAVVVAPERSGRTIVGGWSLAAIGQLALMTHELAVARLEAEG
jgi:hypothetical protein